MIEVDPLSCSLEELPDPYDDFDDPLPPIYEQMVYEFPSLFIIEQSQAEEVQDSDATAEAEKESEAAAAGNSNTSE